MELDLKTKKNITTLVLVLAAALGFRFIFLVGVQKKNEIASKVQEVNEKATILASITSLNKEAAGYDKSLKGKAQQGAFTDRVTSLTKGLSIKVISVMPQPKDEYAEYTRLNMRLELEGAYSQLMEFFKRLDTDDLFIRVDSLEIRSPYLETMRWAGAYDAFQPGGRRAEERVPKASISISMLYKK